MTQHARKIPAKHASISSLVARQLAEWEQGEVLPSSDNQPQSPRRLWSVTRWVGVFSVAIAVVVGVTLVLPRSESHVHQTQVDASAIVNTSTEKDAIVDSVAPNLHRDAINNSRKSLGNAIAQLGNEHPDQTHQLRKLLIHRLLQLGGNWFREAERQIVLLDELPSNPQAVKWMALALIGQLNESLNDDRLADRFHQQDDYWNWLSHQPPGEVLFKATELNPADIDLLANLVELSSTNLDAFEFFGSNRDVNTELLRQRVESKLFRIDSNKDSRSRLVLFRFTESGGQINNAITELDRGAEQAIQRLSRQAFAVSTDGFDQLELATLADQRPAEYWDFMLVAELANRMRSDDPAQASDFYALLTSIAPGLIPPSAMEEIYFQSGDLALSRGDETDAMKIWRQGLKQANANSLLLRQAIADLAIAKHQRLGDSESQDHATDALVRFRNSIGSASTRLANTPPSEMDTLDRRTRGREIQIATWRLKVLDALLQSESGSHTEAIAILERALATQIDIDNAERITAAVQLAWLHNRERAFDCAAATLEQAVQLAPGDLQLRAQAAEFWSRAGNRSRAIEQWQLVGQAKSIDLQVAALEACFVNEINQPSPQRDFRRLHSCVNATQERIRSRSGPEPAEHATEFQTVQWKSNGVLNQPTSHQPLLGRLALLEYALPPIGVTLESHWKSPALINSLTTLAKHFQYDEAIQRLVAEYFAAAGHPRLSNAALLRLESLPGNHSMETVVTRARIEASTGQLGLACKRLSSYAESHIEDCERVLLMAATWARDAHEFELAYDILLSIPASQRSTFALFTIAQTAAQLPLNADILVAEKMNPIELAFHWKAELPQREDVSGTWSKFLEATWLIESMRNDSQEITLHDQRLEKCKSLVFALGASRPYWSEAISLSGALKAIERNPTQAIKALQRGIAAGDQRRQTKDLLHEQLRLVNRTTEFDFENQISDPASGSTFDQFRNVYDTLTRHRRRMPSQFVSEPSLARQWLPKPLRSY